MTKTKAGGFFSVIPNATQLRDAEGSKDRFLACARDDEFNQRGFSLVELSIVLVILGLLVGGVLAGQSLIRAAGLRSVTTEFQKYQSAVNTFRDKYLALPGDMPNAVRFWGAQAGATTDGSDSTCVALTTTASGTSTCNGDGNSIIQGSAFYERYRFWQHLANAGLIEGKYEGVGYSPTVLTGGGNIPKGKMGNSIWQIFMYYDASGTVRYNTVPDSLALWFSGVSSNGSMGGAAPIIKPEEAWNIDVKLDDGKPAYGKVSSLNTQSTNHSNCVTSDTPSSATYNLTFSASGCLLIFSF